MHLSKKIGAAQGAMLTWSLETANKLFCQAAAGYFGNMRNILRIVIPHLALRTKKALSAGREKCKHWQTGKKVTQPSGAAAPKKADTRRRACIRFLRLFFRWRFRWQHKTVLWPREGRPVFRRVCPCVRSFEQGRVCTHFHPRKQAWAVCARG